MSLSSTYVRARIDTDTKDRATAALEGMGLTVSDAIRLLMVKVANERKLPFSLSAPNAETMTAMQEAEHIIASRRAAYAQPEALFDAIEHGEK